MDVEEEVKQRINRWIEEAQFVFDEFSYIAANKPKGSKAKQAELMRKENMQTVEAEKMIREVAAFVEVCYVKLKSIPEPETHIRAVINVLRAGSFFLSYPPESIPTLDFLRGMWLFFVHINHAFSGDYHTVVLSIYEMELRQKTKESLFFYNGIATLGELMDCVQARRHLINFTAEQILECQHVILGRGYSIQPVAENRHYWSEVAPGCGLWKCDIEGKSSFYIEVSPKQEDALLRFACISRTPHGQTVAKLAI